MKRFIRAGIFTLLLTVGALAQQPGSIKSQTALQQRANEERQAIEARADLPVFNLRFEGGTPQQLADTIRADSGKPLNVIIPKEHQDVQLPPLIMKNVTVKQLFEALEQANMRTVPYVTGEVAGRRVINERVSTTSFRTTGPITEDSIWYFQVTAPQTLPEPKVIRYYQLKPFLTEYKIDDLTTAIQAGWEMLGETEMPKLNFHEDTHLLIGVGSSSQLSVIDSVLKELERGLGRENKPATPLPSQPAPASTQKF